MTKQRQTIEEEVIPGIGLLPPNIRDNFNAAQEGFLFKEFIGKLLNNLSTPTRMDFELNRIQRASTSNKLQTIQAYQRNIPNTEAFAELKHAIIQQKIIHFYPLFSSHLSSEAWIELANRPYSLDLFLQPLDENTKEIWFNHFVRDATPAVLEIINACQFDMIQQELSRSYKDYHFLTESEKVILAQKPYSNVFLIEPSRTAKASWLAAWTADTSEDAMQIKEKIQKSEIEKKLANFYRYYHYLDENERNILAQKPYSKDLPEANAWQAAFAQDDSEDLRTIKAKEALRPIKDKIYEYYPGYIYLNQNQREVLANTWYSKSITSSMSRNDWLQALDNDNHESILLIKEHVKNEYHYHIGFLFKNAQSNWDAIIQDMYSSKLSEQKTDVLRRRLNQEWNYESPFWKCMTYEIKRSLNYFLKHPTEEAQKYVDDIANAHAFYRFFGMSSDNIVFGIQFESGANAAPIANLLDLYNYHKNRKALAEALSIWKALRIPLNLFFDEYLEIGRFEKNPLNICLRAFIPFVVMAFFLTFGYSLVLPLATHVFLEYLLFIPSLYLSIAAASLYLHVRNETYSQLVDWYYNGHFNSPLFLANERLKTAFLDEDTENANSLANCVAQYYTRKFEECEKIEEVFSKRKTIMNSNDLQRYQEYSKLKFELYLEWYDIHERTNVPIDQIPKIVKNRLITDRANLLPQIRSNNNDYVSKYSAQCFTFFSDEKNKVLRDECAERNKNIVALESLASKIDDIIKNWDDKLGPSQPALCV